MKELLKKGNYICYANKRINYILKNKNEIDAMEINISPTTSINKIYT